MYSGKIKTEQQLQQFEDGIPLSSFDHRRGEEVPFASFQYNSFFSIPVVEVVNQPHAITFFSESEVYRSGDCSTPKVLDL